MDLLSVPVSAAAERRSRLGMDDMHALQRMAAQYLGSHVLDSANGRDGQLLLHAHGEAKVAQAHPPILRYEDVLKLHIPAHQHDLGQGDVSSGCQIQCSAASGACNGSHQSVLLSACAAGVGPNFVFFVGQNCHVSVPVHYTDSYGLPADGFSAQRQSALRVRRRSAYLWMME